MRVYRDPATGAFVPPPTAAVPAAPTPPPTAQSLGTRRLVEMPGTSRAGGVTIDLQGAFQSEVTATVGADGHVAAGCTRVTAPQ